MKFVWLPKAIVNGDQKPRKYGAAFFSGIENALLGVLKDSPEAGSRAGCGLMQPGEAQPLTRRRGDTLEHSCERGISALTTCKQALFSAIFTRIYAAANRRLQIVMH